MGGAHGAPYDDALFLCPGESDIEQSHLLGERLLFRTLGVLGVIRAAEIEGPQLRFAVEETNGRPLFGFILCRLSRGRTSRRVLP